MLALPCEKICVILQTSMQKNKQSRCLRVKCRVYGELIAGRKPLGYGAGIASRCCRHGRHSLLQQRCDPSVRNSTRMIMERKVFFHVQILCQATRLRRCLRGPGGTLLLCLCHPDDLRALHLRLSANRHLRRDVRPATINL